MSPMTTIGGHTNEPPVAGLHRTPLTRPPSSRFASGGQRHPCAPRSRPAPRSLQAIEGPQGGDPGAAALCAGVCTLVASYQTLHERYLTLQESELQRIEHDDLHHLELEQRDDTIARMHNRIEQLEFHVLTLSARRAPTRAAASSPARCALRMRYVDGVVHPRNVRIPCANRASTRPWPASTRIPAWVPAPTIDCLACTDCDGMVAGISATVEGLRYLRNETMANHVAPHLDRLVDASLFLEQQPEEAAKRRDHLLFQVHMMNADGTFRGLACRKCGFGPMWNDHCSELITHHLQESAPGTRIDNRCPRCNHLVHDVKEMAPWDGDVMAT